jgi:hypothetical protein
MNEAAGGLESLFSMGWPNLIRFGDGSSASIGLGSLRRLAVAVPTAILAYNLFILVGHFVQKC